MTDPANNDIRITPRRSWLIQLVGTVLFAIVIAVVFVFNVKDSFWRTGAFIGIAVLLVTVVVAARPPLLRVRPDGIWIRKFIGSLDVPRSEVVGYQLRHATRVIGGETNSENRQLFLDVRVNGSIERIPAFWCYRFVGLLFSQECKRVDEILRRWMAESEGRDAS